MTSDNRKWFGELCNEVLIEYHEKEMAKCKENARCSRAHKRKMCEIMERPFFITKAISKRLIAALIAAAVLLLAGCTIYLCREEIADFVAEFYEKYLCVTPNEVAEIGNNADISDYYTLGYVPEDFDYVKTVRQPKYAYEKWKNTDGKVIFFRQSRDVNIFLDIKSQDCQELTVNGISVYYSQNSQSRTYVWHDEQHYFRIDTDYILELEELGKLVEGVRKEE